MIAEPLINAETEFPVVTSKPEIAPLSENRKTPRVSAAKKA